MTFRAPKLELLTYIRTPVPGYLAHGVAICTLDGERLEPILAMRTADGGLQLTAETVGCTPGKPDIVLHKLFGGRKLSTLTKTQELVLEAIVRAHVEPLIAAEDAVFGAPEVIDPRLEIVRYLPFPTPPGLTSNCRGAVQVTIDGKRLDPLCVHEEEGALLVSVLDPVVIPPGIDFDFASWPFDLRIDDPLLTREIRPHIVALARHAAMRGEAVP